MLLKEMPFESGEIEKIISSIDMRIRLSQMEIKIANDKIKAETESIGLFQNELIEQKVKSLIETGWQKFVFIAKDKQDQKLYESLEVTFLFKENILPSHFIEMDFECHFGKGFTTGFSNAGVSYKNEPFYEFERWIRSQNTDDYIIVKDIWF